MRRRHENDALARGARHGADGAGADAPTEPSRPRVIARRVSAKPMALDEAVATLDRTGDEFLVFTNDTSQQMAVLYRRKDGNYGLIEPE